MREADDTSLNPEHLVLLLVRPILSNYHSIHVYQLVLREYCMQPMFSALAAITDKYYRYCFYILDMDKPVIGGKQQISAKEGSNFFLSCTAEGYNQVTFQWYFNGQLFQNGSTLSIRNLKRQDAGNYTCNAINEFKAMESDPSVLNVICKCEAAYSFQLPLEMYRGSYPVGSEESE